MSHFPVDHRLRTTYRVLALLTGLASVVFGIAAYLGTREKELFSRDYERVWGMSANPAFALFMLVVGVVVTLAVLVGRNIDVQVNITLGLGIILIGLILICIIRTDANVVAASITNVNVLFGLGLLWLAAGLYGTVSKKARR